MRLPGTWNIATMAYQARESFVNNHRVKDTFQSIGQSYRGHFYAGAVLKRRVSPHAKVTARSSPFRVSRRAPGCLKQHKGCLDQAPEPPASHRLFWLIGHMQSSEAVHHSNEEVPRLLWGET